MVEEMIEEKKPDDVSSPRLAKRKTLFSILILMLIMGGMGYGYFQLARVNLSLRKMVIDLQQKSSNNEMTMKALSNSMDHLQQASKKSEALSMQQEQMITDWQAAQKGNLNKWYAAEAQYLVKLANDNVQFTQNTSLALILLQRAEQILKDLQDPNLLEIQKSLVSDIANLQATETLDVTALYLKLTALTQQINQLPLPLNPLKMAEKKTTPADYANLPWWKAGLNYSYAALQKIVIVRYNGNQGLPLVMPEEKNFLYQNFYAQLEAAMWGALHRNPEVYQASLARAIAWTHQYFDQDAMLTKDFLKQLLALQTAHIAAPTINFATSLQLLAQYISPPETSKMQ